MRNQWLLLFEMILHRIIPYTLFFLGSWAYVDNRSQDAIVCLLGGIFLYIGALDAHLRERNR